MATRIDEISLSTAGGSIAQKMDPASTMMEETAPEELELVPTTYAQAFQIFFFSSHGTGPLLVSISLVIMLATRMMLLGPLSWMDAAVFMGSIVFWSIQEHFLHAQVLHSKVDWYGKQIHQAHHDKPYFNITIDPAPMMLIWMATAGALLRCLFPLPIAISATLGYAMAGLFYEWAHFIVHTKVRPGSAFMKQVRDNHMRHHQIDTKYWFAFSLPLVDDLFGTNPDVRQVVKQKRAAAKMAKTHTKQS
ncbi:Fatty acid hydroxylase [Seminavis robusta]|uniref:Fatty acid hydroxylase n=1 Tax=Seminavis robusta TaxID=568900 RepID=A0A9N8H0Y9_9STRA|nr:Fatty acid hydroxylase [Seminavis robusta]|eukprot:Sro30_g019510.1 Fatty acid hydroxylase (248) ;mRNA; r:48373-49116